MLFQFSMKPSSQKKSTHKKDSNSEEDDDLEFRWVGKGVKQNGVFLNPFLLLRLYILSRSDPWKRSFQSW